MYAFSIALNATGLPVRTPADVKGVVSLIFWARSAWDLEVECGIDHVAHQSAVVKPLIKR